LLAGERTRPQERVAVTVGGHPKKGLLDPDSDPGRAHAVLETAGQALHVNDIIAQIEHKFGERPKRTSLVGALSRYSKHGMHFARFGPNPFGCQDTLPTERLTSGLYVRRFPSAPRITATARSASLTFRRL